MNIDRWMLSKYDFVIKIVNKSENALPKYARAGDAGMDICASEDVTLKAFNWHKVSTGLYVIFLSHWVLLKIYCAKFGSG